MNGSSAEHCSKEPIWDSMLKCWSAAGMCVSKGKASAAGARSLAKLSRQIRLIWEVGHGTPGVDVCKGFRCRMLPATLMNFASSEQFFD